MRLFAVSVDLEEIMQLSLAYGRCPIRNLLENLLQILLLLSLDGEVAQDADELALVDVLNRQLLKLEDDVFVQKRILDVHHILLEDGDQEELGDGSRWAHDGGEGQGLEERKQLLVLSRMHYNN